MIPRLIRVWWQKRQEWRERREIQVMLDRRARCERLVSGYVVYPDVCEVCRDYEQNPNGPLQAHWCGGIVALVE